MTSLLLLIPLSALVLIGAGLALFWAIDRGQFEDLETPALLPMTDADATPDSAKDAAEKPS